MPAGCFAEAAGRERKAEVLALATSPCAEQKWGDFGPRAGAPAASRELGAHRPSGSLDWCTETRGDPCGCVAVELWFRRHSDQDEWLCDFFADSKGNSHFVFCGYVS